LSATGSRHGSLSRFPQDLCRFAVKFYTEEKLDRPGYFGNYFPTVLDPFAGHNSRMESTWLCNRNYVGWDISNKFMKMNKEVVEELKKQNAEGLFPKSEAQIELVLNDSRNMDYKEQFDFAITSPPYWNIEDYGDEAGQLGKLGSYNTFLDGLTKVFENVYNGLKYNTFFAVESQDFLKGGIFYTFHSDVIDCLRKVGFKIWDIIIEDYGNSFLTAFPISIASLKKVAKIHSYLIIAKKEIKRVKVNPQELRRGILEIAKQKGQTQELKLGSQLNLGIG